MNCSMNRGLHTGWGVYLNGQHYTRGDKFIFSHGNTLLKIPLWVARLHC